MNVLKNVCIRPEPKHGIVKPVFSSVTSMYVVMYIGITSIPLQFPAHF